MLHIIACIHKIEDSWTTATVTLSYVEQSSGFILTMWRSKHISQEEEDTRASTMPPVRIVNISIFLQSSV